MAKRPQDRWLLLRLAAQNVGRRRLRAIILAVAVMLGVGVGFAGFVTGWALSNGIAANLARMGADLLVVPRNTLVNITASLLTVQPTNGTLPSDLADKLSVMPGVARVAPQRIVPVLVDGQPANLIAFDPMRDFSVLPWIGLHRKGPLDADQVVAGARVSGEPGGEVVICGKPMRIYGRLERTGVGPFDESWFVSFDGLGDIAAFCRANRAAVPAGAEIAGGERDHHVDGQACLPDTRLDRVSAFLLQLAPGAKIDEVRFALGQLPSVRIVEGNTVLTTSRQALSALLLGIAVFTLVQLTAVLIVVSLLFSAMVQERWREVGLLRAMGAKSCQIMTVILGEAAIITGLGGLAGLIFGVALLLGFARSLGFYFGLLGIPFFWPPFAILETGAIVAVTFSATLGLVGAFVPAWRACGMAPYALIQAEVR
jgi:putative ABC transport system permease protein